MPQHDLSSIELAHSGGGRVGVASPRATCKLLEQNIWPHALMLNQFDSPEAVSSWRFVIVPRTRNYTATYVRGAFGSGQKFHAKASTPCNQSFDSSCNRAARPLRRETITVRLCRELARSSRRVRAA